MYEKALKSARKNGAAYASDTELMALFCEGFVPALVGYAVSPSLVWSGAVNKGLTTRQLVALTAVDPQAVSDLQW